MIVRGDLHFDMSTVDDRALQDEFVARERVLRLRPRRLDRVRQVIEIGHETHAATAATIRRFDHDRDTDFIPGSDEFGIARPGFSESRDARNGRIRHQRLRGAFVRHHLDRFRGRSDERDAAIGTCTSKLGILGQEPVARVNRVRTASSRRCEHLLDVEIRFRGRVAGKRHGDIGERDER